MKPAWVLNILSAHTAWGGGKLFMNAGNDWHEVQPDDDAWRDAIAYSIERMYLINPDEGWSISTTPTILTVRNWSDSPSDRLLWRDRIVAFLRGLEPTPSGRISPTKRSRIRTHLTRLVRSRENQS